MYRANCPPAAPLLFVALLCSLGLKTYSLQRKIVRAEPGAGAGLGVETKVVSEEKGSTQGAGVDGEPVELDQKVADPERGTSS